MNLDGRKARMGFLVRWSSRCALAVCLAGVVAFCGLSCHQQDKSEDSGPEQEGERQGRQGESTESIELGSFTERHYHNISHLRRNPTELGRLLAQIEERYPYLHVEVDVSIKNLSLDDALKVLESSVGRRIPYRLVGSGFHPIEEFVVSKMPADSILVFLADLSGATLALEEDGIVFVKE
ncbi:MAG: hypothetical protein KAX80_02085 [Planctomycetes bacterium]|nr:hypothetical protein [Planctomycetota bacterium]